jgi:hypothetical protein
MWTTILGGLLGAGAGYGAYAYSRQQQDACFAKNYVTAPVPPDATVEQQSAAETENVSLMAQVSAACSEKHPIRTFLSDDMYLAIGGGLLVGGLTGFFAFRKK